MRGWDWCSNAPQAAADLRLRRTRQLLIEIAVIEASGDSKPIVAAARQILGLRSLTPFDAGRAGMRLVKRKNAKDQALGCALVGYALMHLSWNKSKGPICARILTFPTSCFRHVAPRSKYCSVHAPSSRSARSYMADRRLSDRLIEIVERAPALLGGRKFLLERQKVVHAMYFRANNASLIHDFEDIKPDLSDFFRLFTEYQEILGKAPTRWEEMRARLQERLKDKHCYSTDPALWHAKVSAFSLELKVEEGLTHPRADKRHIRRSKVVEAIRQLAPKGLTRSEIAQKLGVHPSAVTMAIKRQDELRKLFKERGKASQIASLRG